jgi:glycosyltransferase involved in cell wall biosynthesis
MILYFIVTNDLSYDQRMIRICTSMANAGYTIKLVGRKLNESIPLLHQPFLQKRIKCLFNKGRLFYAEYNIRIFFYLLFKRMDCICAIDLDTILPCYLISKIKKVPRVYDAHELFCEMKEVVSRPNVHKAWKRIEKFSVPKFNKGYTVNQYIADEFYKMYKVNYGVIRNMPVKQDIQIPIPKTRYILYQGAVNEGRGFESIIPAMRSVNAQLVICGGGNFMERAKQLISENGLNNKIILKGYIPPTELQAYTLNAYIGINLVDNTGLNNYYSLANRFFDYIHAGLPQLCIDLPAYREINDQYEVAVLIPDIGSGNISSHLNRLLEDELLHHRLQKNCMTAREVYNWQNEEKKLIHFYKTILPG